MESKMFSTIKTVVSQASERAARRRAYRFLEGQSDHILRDIGLTRGDLYRSVVIGSDRG